MKWSYRQLTTLFILFLFAFFMVENPLTDLYIAKLKADAVTVSNIRDSLYYEIDEKKEEYDKKPIDAKIDPVWKKMPGLYGYEVDVEASYKRMKESGTFDENHLVYREIPPRVSLKDLPPAPIYRGSPEKPMVAFTFNVAWGNEHISPILKILKEKNIHATFFIEGRWAKQHPDLVKMIADAGHEIGNHSYSHPDMRNLNREQIKKELADTNSVLQAAAGKEIEYFAPPSGTYNDAVVKMAAEMGMETIMWTVDTIDWQKPAPATIVIRVTKQVHNGAIVLMHPTEPTVQALEPMITQLKEKGYAIGSVGELLDERLVDVVTVNED